MNLIVVGLIVAGVLVIAVAWTTYRARVEAASRRLRNYFTTYVETATCGESERLPLTQEIRRQAERDFLLVQWAGGESNLFHYCHLRSETFAHLRSA